MGFNDDLATVHRYFASAGTPNMAVLDLCRAIRKKEENPDACIDDLVENSLMVCRAIEIAKRGYDEEKDRKYFIKNPGFYNGIEEVFKRELTSYFSGEVTDEFKKIVEEFWKKWEPRCSEIKTLVDSIKNGKVDKDLFNRIVEYMHEVSSLAEKHLHRDYRGASASVCGFSRIPR